MIGGVATLFVLMATSLDPLQIVNAGAEPWIDAAEWSAAFVVEVIAAVVALRLWHSVRWRPAALLAVAGQVVGVAWACALLRADYF